MDVGGEPRVKRKMKTIFQLNVLEETYAGNAYPSKKVRAKLPVQLNLTDRQLQKWFCNRRIKDRKTPKKIDYNMGKTKERVWRNTNNCMMKRKLLILDDYDDDDDGGGDVELLDPRPEHYKLVENVSPMLDSPEKFPSCQSDMVCVQGYKVKRSIAKILEAIFKKHGDIAAYCVFKTSSMRTHFLEVVCEVIKRIQTNNMTEMVKGIECQLLDAEAANINVSWIRAHFEACHKRKEVQMLMETKASITLVKEPALMDLVMRYEKLMAAYEQFEENDRCMQVLHLVEKKLNNILESKEEKHVWVNQPIL